MVVTLTEARKITRAVAPAGATLGRQAYEDATYWLVPVYLPMDQEEAGSPVPVVRKNTGAVEWRMPHLPPISRMTLVHLADEP